MNSFGFVTVVTKKTLIHGLCLCQSIIQQTSQIKVIVIANDPFVYRVVCQLNWPLIVLKDCNVMTPTQVLLQVLTAVDVSTCVYLDPSFYFFGDPTCLFHTWHPKANVMALSAQPWVGDKVMLGVTNTQEGREALQCLESGRDFLGLETWQHEGIRLPVLDLSQYTLENVGYKWVLSGRDIASGQPIDLIVYRFPLLTKTMLGVRPAITLPKLIQNTLYPTYLATYKHMRQWVDSRVIYHKTPLSLTQTTDCIVSALDSKEPFMACRIGGVEFSCLLHYLACEHRPFKWFKQGIKDQMRLNAGFFSPDNHSLLKVSRLYLQSIAQANLIAAWQKPQEPDFFNRFCPNAHITLLRHLNPVSQHPWSRALRDIKVLVIHPFVKSIQSQFLKRDQLFANRPDILPPFELKTLRAVQSIAGNPTAFQTWFDAYEWMCSEIDAIDFDVAIIGAGAYGLPLAAYVKGIGKQAIHLGGATQTLFGITGKRWDDESPYIMSFKNEHWIRPLADETPRKFKKIESGCYW